MDEVFVWNISILELGWGVYYNIQAGSHLLEPQRQSKILALNFALHATFKKLT